MALSGLHVLCAATGPSSKKGVNVQLPSAMLWSETIASAGTTTHSASAPQGDYGPIIFEVTASADSFVAIGLTPNASSGARAFVPANTPTDFIVKSGDKLAWIAA